MSASPLNPLVGKIRNAHPGAYDDMDDAALTKAVLRKYPQYEDLARPASAIPGAPSTQPMQKSNVGIAAGSENTPSSAIANPQQPAERFALDNPEEQGPLLGAAAIGAAGTGGPGIVRAAAPTVAGLVAKHPIMARIAGTAAISQARKLPVVGKMIPSYAEMLPWMAGGAVSEPAGPPARLPSEPIPEAPPEPVASPKSGPIETAPEPTAPESTPIAASAPAPIADKRKIGDLLNESLGGKIPEGHTPVKSTAIRSYKYDPTSREFEATTASGTYIHGDVSPDQVAAFEKASSKGRAWSDLKNNSTYVGKIVNGERVAAKPPRDLGSASPDDLTPLLQQSVEAAKKAKAARIARPN